MAAGAEAQDSDERDHPTASHTPFVGARQLGALRAAIEHYRQLDAAGGWPAIGKGPQLRAGDTDERVALVRRRLELETGRVARYASGQFDADLEDAIRAFQRRHGLRASGVLNGETITALNVPAAARLAQLAHSAERLAELLAHTQSGAYVLVNVPSYELQVVAQGRVLLYSRVVVGKTSTQTPTVRASIRAVDLMPYWHVPPGIAERAIIPAVRKDPNYLARERIRVFSAWGGAEIDPATVNWHAPQATRYVFRQDPGPHNALGLVRIDMPNQFTVYMHDTPMKRLFASRNRPFSAGCVRVQNIFALAGLLLGEDELTVQRRLEPLLASGTRTTLKVATPVPVHFTYLTAWVGREDRAEFRHDLYGKDDVQARVAEAAPAPAVARADPWHTRVFDLSP
jgi:murein L,D-transpeptidase YcbB/YkuD